MIFYSTIIIGLIIDFFTKFLALNFIENKINIIGDLFYLVLIKNDGIAFGIDLPFLKILTIILIIGIFYYYFKEERKNNNKYIDLAFGLILAGAIGNGFERIFFSEVIDFFGIKGFSIFNFADIFITLGAIIYLIINLKNKK